MLLASRWALIGLAVGDDDTSWGIAHPEDLRQEADELVKQGQRKRKKRKKGKPGRPTGPVGPDHSRRDRHKRLTHGMDVETGEDADGAGD